MYTVGEQDDHDHVVPAIDPPPDGSPWMAPTKLEELLTEHSTSAADDEDASTRYLGIVAGTGLMHPVQITHTAPNPRKRQLLTTELETGHTILPVYTQGVLPRPHPYVVYEFVSLGTLAEICPQSVDVLAVNPHTPCEAYFRIDDTARKMWQEMEDAHFNPNWSSYQIITQRTGGAEPGPLLHGLACGAHLCFVNGDAWNILDWHGPGYSNEVRRLEEWWDIKIREDWLETQDALLNRKSTPWYWDFVLGARNWLIDNHGPHVDAEMWRHCVEVTMRNNVAEGSEPGTPVARGADPELDDFIDHLRDLVGKVIRYEARFRADEILPPDGIVRTVAAWDLGRASKMARWGRGARYATQAEMYQALERASQASQAAYESWHEFSVGYVLGRCLHFDDEEFGDWYQESLVAHHTLTTDPESPWQVLPFQLAP